MTTRKNYLSKVILVLTASLIMALFLMGSSMAMTTSNTFEQDEPYRVEEFTIDTPGDLQVRTSGGYIAVEGSDSDKVRVEMIVKKDGKTLSNDDVKLEKWDINISKSGNNTVKAIAKHQGNNWSLWNNNRISISFVVHTPTQISTDLKTSGGHIETRNLEGNQSIATSGGHLNLANLKGTIEAKTSGGHIDLTDMEGEVRVKTSGGHINASNVAGTLDAKTSGGHIELGNVNGSISASTSGGSITANLKSINKFVDLKTSGGNVDITIPDNIGVDLQLKGTFVHGKLNNFSGVMDDNEINGQLNGGGPKVSARTSGGAVRLSFN